MIDLGKKQSETKVSPISENSNKTYYPYLTIDSKLPLDENDLNKEIVCRVKLKLNSYNESVNKSKKSCSYSFDVLGIELKPSASEIKSMSKDELDDAEKREFGFMKMKGY